MRIRPDIIYRLAISSFLTGYILWPAGAWSLKLKDPELEGKTNPHWTGNSCLECHETKPEEGKPATLKFGGDFIKLCNRCHETKQLRAEEHIVGVPLREDANYIKPPKEFLLQDGNISCITCHECKPQRQQNLSAKEKNSAFLRGGAPYNTYLTFEWVRSEATDVRYKQNRYGICLFCHKSGAVLQWSPHKNQVETNGQINEELCLYCHSDVPDRAAVEAKDWKLNDPLQYYCVGCHMGKTRFHPIRVTHYGCEPPEKIKNQIKYSERRLGVIVPYGQDATGINRLTCPSCHTAHQQGVLKNQITMKGADSNKRLRVEGFGMCLTCHGEAVGVPVGGAPF